MTHWVGDRNQLFSLPVSSLVDGHPQTVAGLPSLFNIRVLLNSSYDGLAAHYLPGQFNVPPKRLPTVWSRLAMAKPKISSLVTCSHLSSSGNVCTEEEVIAAKHRYRASCFGFANWRSRLGISFWTQRECFVFHPQRSVPAAVKIWVLLGSINASRGNFWAPKLAVSAAQFH
jgi:hypothetical protein